MSSIFIGSPDTGYQFIYLLYLTCLQLWEKMADESRFGPELTEEELLILEFLTKPLFYSGLLDTKCYNQRGAYLSLHIQRALVE